MSPQLKEQIMLDRLFEPGKIGCMEVKNRILMAPLGHFSADAGSPTSRTIDYYVERAKGGAGLIFTGGCSIVREARIPGMFWLYDDKFIPKLTELTQAVHAHGAKIATHLVHFGKVLSDENFPIPGWEKDPVCASAIPWVSNDLVPREATRDDIRNLTESFALAALRSKKAGFDAVELMLGHGYMMSSFLSPFTNKRTDEYGGSVENRARFACETITRIREEVGDDFSISVRFSASEYLEGGITLEDTLHQIPYFIKAGADVLHVSASATETTEWQFLCYLYPDAAIVDLAAAVKQVSTVPVIAVGKITNPWLANQILEDGKADYIALGRPLMADPYWPNKVQEDKFEDVCQCIYCNNCMATPRTERLKFGGLYCTVNPALFREKEFTIRHTDAPKEILVAGGGLAGMEVSRVLAERGHHVTLYERNQQLGGQWRIASRQASKKRHYGTVTERLSKGLKNAGVNVIVGREVTPSLVKDTKPDAVVVATGATPLTPEVPGVLSANVVQAVDVADGRAKVGQTAVVIGGHYLGMEIALSLATQDKTVSLVTRGRLGGTGKRLEVNIFRTLLRELIKNRVQLFPHCPVVEICSNGVHINFDHQLVFLTADTVVLAVGMEPQNKLVSELKGVVAELFVIGDCVEPRDALRAMREGAELGRKI
jgi:2,4-dienoyl-CoA reductase-like NADH-dependent reductase (Old Yellow Enzyme family)